MANSNIDINIFKLYFIYEGIIQKSNYLLLLRTKIVSVNKNI